MSRAKLMIHIGIVSLNEKIREKNHQRFSVRYRWEQERSGCSFRNWS